MGQAPTVRQLRVYKSEGKTISVQAWIWPESSRKLKLPEFLENPYMKVARLHPRLPQTKAEVILRMLYINDVPNT